MRTQTFIIILFIFLNFSVYAQYEDDEADTIWYGISDEVSFDKSNLLANYLEFMINYPSGDALSINLYVAPYESSLSKNLGFVYTKSFSENFSLYGGASYNFPINGYKNFGLNIGTGFSFGNSILFQPGFDFELIRHSQSQYSETSQYFSTLKKEETFVFTQLVYTLSLGVEIYDTTSISFQISKNDYSTDLSQKTSAEGYKLISIFYRYPNLVGTLMGFVDRSVSINISQSISSFLSIEAGITKANYLLTKQEEIFVSLSPVFYISESWETSFILNYSQSSNQKSLNYAVSLSYYWN